MKHEKVTSPIYIILPRVKTEGKKIALNLNVYRNLHYHENNQVKESYKNIMSIQLDSIKFDNPIAIDFVLYKPSKARIDRANILCIVEKLFCDALTHCGCIPDDNDDFIESTHYFTEGVDSKNPRCEIFITEVGE